MQTDFYAVYDSKVTSPSHGMVLTFQALRKRMLTPPTAPKIPSTIAKGLWLFL